MILETIVTTQNLDGTINIAPMGSRCEAGNLDSFELRPFDTSRTGQNLKRTGQGILHITDNVLLFARSSIGASHDGLHLRQAEKVDGQYLADCCRCYEFETTWMEETTNRATIHCRTIHSHRFRDFPGFNRARFAVLEASILATRIDFLPFDEIQNRFDDLEQLVIRTGDNREQEAFDILRSFLARHDDSTTEATDPIETRQT